MAVQINIEINLLDLLRDGDAVLVRKGQQVIRGEIVMEDTSEYIFNDQASLIVE